MVRAYITDLRLSISRNTHTQHMDAIWIEVLCKDGCRRQVDISWVATQPFGFVYQERVDTPLGPGYALGVSNGNLYFQLDFDSAASYWSDCANPAAFERRGITRSSTAPSSAVAPPTLGVHTNSFIGGGSEYHNLKAVLVGGARRMVVMQSLNGPCPIIALANALILKNCLREIVPTGSTAIEANVLRAQLLRYLRDPHAPPKCSATTERNGEKTLAGVISDTVQLEALRAKMFSADEGEALLKKFYGGLDVSPIFCDIDGFDAEMQTALFALAGVRLVHGWILPVTSPYHHMSFNDLQVKATEDTDANELLACQQQLTELGLAMLTESLENEEVCVMFYNNHFSTVVKKDGYIFRLASDVSFVDRSCIVFEKLVDAFGGVAHTDGDGVAPDALLLQIQCQKGDMYTEDEIQLMRAQFVSEHDREPSLDVALEKLEEAKRRQQSSSALVLAPSPSKCGNPLEPQHAASRTTSSVPHIPAPSYTESELPSVLATRDDATQLPIDEDAEAQNLVTIGAVQSLDVARVYIRQFGSAQAAVNALYDEG